MNPFDDLPPTPFTAELIDRLGHVTGRTTEPDMFGGPDAAPIPATLDGHHAGGELVFTKFPEGGGQIHTIDYVGAISDDANSVSGRWIIYGVWEGVFRMQRRVVTTEASVEVRASV